MQVSPTHNLLFAQVAQVQGTGSHGNTNKADGDNAIRKEFLAQLRKSREEGFSAGPTESPSPSSGVLQANQAATGQKEAPDPAAPESRNLPPGSFVDISV